MKHEIKLIGIDDSPFSFTEKYCSIIGVIMRGNGYLEGVIKSQVKVDGNDATNVCKSIINQTRHKKQLKAILLDGVALGGFNVVDIEEIYNDTCIPIITVTRDKPDFRKIKAALIKNFKDWEKRFEIMKKGKMHRVQTSHNPIFVKCVGLSINEAKEIIKLSTIRGVVPEPIRVAHLIASGVTRGESYGKA